MGNPLFLTAAFLGGLLCSLNAAGARFFCATSGCDLYAGYQFAGISFYVWGTIGFALLLGLGLLSRRHAYLRPWLLWALSAALLLDSGFLLWQVLFWPCTSCLAVAVLLAVCAVALLRASSKVRLLKAALVLWSLFFLPAAVAAGKELLLQPWVLTGEANAPVTVFFSPTCPSCQKTVQAIVAVPDLKAQTSFLPIAKNEEDFQRLALFLEQGGTDIMQLFAPFTEPQVSVGLKLRLQLARNKMLLARTGRTSVPLILSTKLVFSGPEQDFIPQENKDYRSFLFGSPQSLELESGCSVGSVEQSCE